MGPLDLAARAAGWRGRAAGNDRADRALQRVASARALALDLDIGFGDRSVRRRQAFGCPAGKLLAGLVDTPRRHPEIGSERVRAHAPAYRTDQPECPQAL